MWGNIAKLNILSEKKTYLTKNLYIKYIKDKKKPVKIPDKIKKYDTTGFSMYVSFNMILQKYSKIFRKTIPIYRYFY